MPNPMPEDQPEKTTRKGRRLLFIALSLVLLGLIGMGALQVFQPGDHGEINSNTTGKSSTAGLENSSNPSETDPNADTAQNESPGDDEKDPDSDNDSQTSESNERDWGMDDAEPEPALSISGAVLDDTGNLLPGISVSANPIKRPAGGQSSTPVNAGGMRQQTDQLGSFTFDNLPEGEYELAVAESEQYHPVTLRVRAGVANAELVLQRIRSVRVYGTITDDVGNPLEGVQVRALGSREKILSNISGEYEILTSPSKAGQPPVLDFSLEGYKDARQRVEGVLGSEATEIQLDVQLEWESDAPEVAVYGLVYGPATEPVTGATVWLRSSEFNVTEKTRSRSSGEYRFEEVKVGDAYTISVEPRGNYAAFKSETLSIGPGDLNYDVKLEATGLADLSGVLTDLKGAPLKNFMLWARNTEVGGQKPIPLHTDGAGQFRLEQITSGTIKLESRSQPWLEVTGIVLKPGESRRVEIPLDWGERWLLGQVVDGQGNPVPRAKVVLQWSELFANFRSASRREVMSDQGGYFALSNLDADMYAVTVQATGFASYRIEHRMGRSDEELRVILTRRN